MVMPIASQETKKIWHGSSDPQKVLQLHHREHPGCITAWYGNCSASDRKALQRVVNTAQYITRPSFLPSRTSIPGGVRGRP
ncbi:unnamed protein product [Oncorhynchus mykiss]|uniref:Uncharacterized protein n=1 Tax=Oncorhynchus mykiss TaxID=8022 RepID=A0A060XEX0_ONCMY|nr:unnamed protein product [Oncorhynchus mykiss]